MAPITNEETILITIAIAIPVIDDISPALTTKYGIIGRIPLIEMNQTLPRHLSRGYLEYLI